MVITKKSSTSNGSNANMNSANNLNASACASAIARGSSSKSAIARGSSSKSSVRANIGKGKPNVTVASPLPTSVSQVNQKIEASATTNTTDDVKSASTSQQQSSSAGENPLKSSMNSLEGGSKGRNRFTPQQDQKPHQRNSSLRKGPQPPGDSPGSRRQNHISHLSFNGGDAQQHMQPTYLDSNTTIAKQIEYYFSPESLQENIFLRQNMDEQGWVPVCVIAGFHEVKQLVKGIPDCIQFILRAVRGSAIVETKGYMIRKRMGLMNDHFKSSNAEGTSEVTASNQMKDHLRGFSALDKVEDIRNSFYNFIRKLPKKMEMHDKIIVVDAMKGLREDLERKCNPIKQKLDVAAELYSEKIFELVDKHPGFQELLSDEQKLRIKLLDTAIAENKSKLPKKSKVSDEQLVKFKALHQELQQVEDEYKSLISKVVEYGQMIHFVDSFISIVHNKDTV